MVGSRAQKQGAAVVSPEQLAELIRGIERQQPSGCRRTVSTGWGDHLPEVVSGVLHEWIGLDDEAADPFDAPDRSPSSSQQNQSSARGRHWSPPLLILAHLARQIIAAADVGTPDGAPSVLWIGRAVWPHARILTDRVAADRTLLDRSLFIDTPDAPRHIWAIDLALRCPAVALVVADGRGVRLPHTRRLQLAAEHGGGWAMLVRPPWERACRTVAATRWLVQRICSPDSAPRWRITLWRCKGVQRRSAADAHASSIVEWNRETTRIHPPADVVDRSRTASTRQAAG